VESKEEDAKDH